MNCTRLANTQLNGGKKMHVVTFVLFWCLKYIIDFQYMNLYPQDLECDVSVEDDNRQEWIFTLYDFDNSGKVTKEVCLFWLSLVYPWCRIWHRVLLLT